MAVTFMATSPNGYADLTHTAMHWDQEAHHHHGDSGEYHLDDSDESTQHLMADQAHAAAVLPVAGSYYFRPGAISSASLPEYPGPNPFLEGLLRPPRLTTV